MMTFEDLLNANESWRDSTRLDVNVYAWDGNDNHLAYIRKQLTYCVGDWVCFGAEGFGENFHEMAVSSFSSVIPESGVVNLYDKSIYNFGEKK